MRQTHPLTHPRHKPAQAVALLKNKLRKYIKRERNKKLPEGVDYWDFDCRIGATEDEAAEVHLSQLLKELDGFVAAGKESVYVEILAKPGVRRRRESSEE